MNLTPGARFTDPVTGYPATVTSVDERRVVCRYDFGEGKVGVNLSLETAQHLASYPANKAEIP